MKFRLFTMIRLILCRNGINRAKYIKKHNLVYHMGEHCYWHPVKLPVETYLLNIHNNVTVTANVTFVTHDIMEYMFNYMNHGGFEQYIGSIEVFDNVFIGTNSIIMPNIKIGPNAIIASGSVVTKDVPEGVVVGGNPAKVIGKFDDLMNRRRELDVYKNKGVEKIIKYFWEDSSEI